MKYIYLFSFTISLLFFAMNVRAYTQDALSTKVTLEVKKASLLKVFKIIERKADVKFAYSNDNIDPNYEVSCSFKDEPLIDVLNNLTQNLNLSFDAIGNLIAIHKNNSINNAPTHAGNIITGNNNLSAIPGQITISGNVTDKMGAPLVQVSVKVKGSTAGTVTNVDGNYTIKADENAVLIFSYIGYLTQEVVIGKRTSINVVLADDQKALNEVIVVGYGTQKRENVIGSISQISAEQLESRPVTELQNAITGQLPGVTVTQSSGRPGSSANTAINIRGVGSFGSDPSPLILVDDMPVADMTTIDPNDVASLTVLKDASSAAIYGSRAANGVILITTKTGRKGKTVVNYSGYSGAQKATAFPDYLGSYEYALAYNLAKPGTFTPTDLQLFQNGTDPDHHPDTHFLQDILSKHGVQVGNNISVSGGTDKSTFDVSAGYLYQDGLVVKNNYSKANLRINLKTELNSKFDLTTRISVIDAAVNEPGSGSGGVLNVIDQAVKLPANLVGIYQDGSYGDGVNLSGTPISTLASQSYYKTDNLNLTGNLRLDYKVIPGLKLSFITGYVRTDGQTHSFAATQQLHSVLLQPNSITEGSTYARYYTTQGLADYNKQFGKSQITALVGYSFEHYSNSNITAFRDNLPGNDLTVINVGSTANQQSTGTGSESDLESEFARINYAYAEKYLVEVVGRRDGSSRFPTNRKYAYFPSAAIGWRIGQEKFIKDNYTFVSELKMKASIGVLGNQNIGNYPYQNVLVTNSGNSGTNYSFGGVVVPGVQKQTLTDSTIHWESTRTADVGLEFGFFKNKLTGSATYFQKTTYDILYSPSASVSNVLGYNLSVENTGSLSNKGWEFTLNYNDHIGKFAFFANSNFSIINNKVLSLGVGNILQPNGLVGNGSTLFVGYPFQLFYGYKADHIFANAADVASYPNQTAINPTAQPGDIRYADLNGDGKVTATDREVLGSQIPKYTFGMNLGGSFQGFDINVLLQGVADVQGYLYNNEGYAFWNGANIQRWQYEGAWTPTNPNPNAAYPRLEIFSNAGSANTLTSSFWVVNASYVRIKNAQLGYTLRKNLLQKIGINSLRIFFSGDNLHTFSHYRQGWDPEISGQSGYYPILATYTLGINASF